VTLSLLPLAASGRLTGLPALLRLGAVWRAWETLRHNLSIGIARWLRDIADPQMDRLRDPDRGPFTACGDHHLLPEPLPLQPLPAESPG